MKTLIKSIILMPLLWFSACVSQELSLKDNKILTTNYNSNYDKKMVQHGTPRQETPWGFQEIVLKHKVEHWVKSIAEYQKLIQKNTKNYEWTDNRVHVIHFAQGVYSIPKGDNYFVLVVPSQTIIEGAGIGNTVFKAREEIDRKDKYYFRKLFNLEFATHDVVVRGISFHNETKDNKWGLFHANGARDRENYLFENIEFDDAFGAIGMSSHESNFITFRGLKKRIGNTTNRIKKNFTIPIPQNYEFHSSNKDNVQWEGQLGIREGASVVVHDCILGDNISVTLDIYANYVEVVGVKFINPLHDHAIKAPNGNHLYIHESSFDLNYKTKLIESSDSWNPTFFTHEVTNEETVSLRKNYHFKNLEFIRKHQKIAVSKKGKKIDFIESEPFTIYDERIIRKNNVSGDMVWENITFRGYSKAHQVLGYPNVQTDEGYEALNYTSFVGVSAQIKENNNNQHGSYSVEVQNRSKSSIIDRTGVYSWGKVGSHKIDYPRDNRLFRGTKLKSRKEPYIRMKISTMKNDYFRHITK